MLRLEDIETIRQLIYRYSFYVDRREFDLLGDLLADATFRLTWEKEGVETGEINGKAEIEAWYGNHLKDRRPSRHVITNIVIDVAEDGETATAEGYVTSTGYDPEPPPVLLSGHYEDRFAKIDGEWRFTLKYCVMELP